MIKTERMEFKLIVKKLNGTLTESEAEVFEKWHAESDAHRAYFDRVRENYLQGLDMVDIQKGWEKVSSNIGPKRKPKTYWKYAAAVAALIVLGSLPFVFDKKDEVPGTVTAPVPKADPIQIGTDKATLTLEDGSNVVLEKGKSYTTEKVSSDGEKLIYKTPTDDKEKVLAHNVLTIPRGGQFFLTLTDGTRVWLNSDSQLKYPVAFATENPRVVELMYGEAYFEVSPSTAHNGAHFLVKTREQLVDVLGTEFNIKAYKEDDFIATTLVEGKVGVKKGSATTNLSPGHQSLLHTRTDEIRVVPVDVYNEISWKNGFFSFKDKSLEDIMAVLARWYDVDVVFKNDVVRKITFNGVFRKSQQLEEILRAIENTKEVNYTINQKTIRME